MSAPDPHTRTAQERADHAAETLRWLDAESQDAVSRAGQDWQSAHPDHR